MEDGTRPDIAQPRPGPTMGPATYECVFDEHFEEMSGEEKVAAIIMNVVHNFVILKKQTAVQLPLLCRTVPHPLQPGWFEWHTKMLHMGYVCVCVCADNQIAHGMMRHF